MKKIKKIKSLGVMKVYDVSVANDNRNFKLDNGIIAHNCQSTQPALRGFIEEFHDNCRFILTCNYQNRILPAIQSRCAVIDFRMTKTDKSEIRMEFISMIHGILKAEGIKFDNKVLIQIIRKYFPDIRRIINELQRYGACGEIDTGILVSLAEDKVSTLIKALKDREYNVMKKWVNENIDNDSDTIFQNIYDGVHDSAKNESIPIAVITIADYMYKSAFVMSQEINLVACLTELMAKCDWK